MPEEIDYKVNTTPRAKPINEMNFEDISREIATGTTGRTWNDFKVGDKTIAELLNGAKNDEKRSARRSRKHKAKEPVKFRDAFQDLVED